MADERKASFLQQVLSLPANFWFANFMEILERLAFFGVRAVAPLYLVKTAGDNGLGLDYVAKGQIYTVWALIQCLVPMVSGGYTERYGYKRSLLVAFSINIVGYLLMARSSALAATLAARGVEDAGFWSFLLAACLVAFGTAIFKPPVHGTIAKTTTEETSSMGWGIFYWVVNIGGALAPMAAASLRGEIDWHVVFYGAAIVTACNFLPALFLYKEPVKDGTEEAGETEEDGGEAERGPLGVFAHSISTLFSDLRLVGFLVIFSCFWLMFMQLWDLLPNFIDEWVDTSGMAGWFSAVSSDWVLESGQVKPEMIINLNPAFIILAVLPISWLVGKVHKVLAMIVGMVISVVGFVAAGATPIGWFCCVMILVFTVGEMTCSPTFSAYVGLIAPRDKKALYMGYSNIPFAIGWALGNTIGGSLYEEMGSKFKLARHYLMNHGGVDPALAMDADKLPNAQVMERMAALLHGGRGGTVEEATRLLWDLHQPYLVWYYLGAIGLAGTLGMVVFYVIAGKARPADGEEAEDQAEAA